MIFISGGRIQYFHNCVINKLASRFHKKNDITHKNIWEKKGKFVSKIQRERERKEIFISTNGNRQSAY